MRCSVRFLSVPRPLKRVQDLVAPIYSGADLLLPRERNRILDVANDAPVYKVQFGREVELNRHVVINRGQNQKFPAIFTASAQLLGANAACEVAKKFARTYKKTLPSWRRYQIWSNTARPLSSQATASPSRIQDRDRRRGQRLDDEGEAVCQAVARTAIEPHP
jgi:hypothetical protein